MKILFLSTWFPYPLSQGSKIRAYHLLKALAKRHEVALVSFEDLPVDQLWISHLRQFCQSVDIISKNPFSYNRWKALAGWFSAQPSAVKTFYSPEMAEHVSGLAAKWDPQCVVALTFVAAPYAVNLRNSYRIVDVDYPMTFMLYEAFLQERNAARRLRKWLAWKKFQNYERQLYRQFDHCLVVSERDRQMSLDLIGLPPASISVVPNGAEIPECPPVEPVPNTLIFNGALTYPVNFRSMDTFLREIFPSIREQVPGVRLRITGRTEGVPLDRLPLNSQVTLTGYLDDVRPAVMESSVCIVPLNEGGGTRLKILEAMALGTPVVSTTKGVEGIDVEAGKHLLIADTPEDFARQTIRILRDPELRRTISANACRRIVEQYEWSGIGGRFCDLIEKKVNVEKGI